MTHPSRDLQYQEQLRREQLKIELRTQNAKLRECAIEAEGLRDERGALIRPLIQRKAKPIQHLL